MIASGRGLVLNISSGAGQLCSTPYSALVAPRALDALTRSPPPSGPIRHRSTPLADVRAHATAATLLAPPVLLQPVGRSRAPLAEPTTSSALLFFASDLVFVTGSPHPDGGSRTQ